MQRSEPRIQVEDSHEGAGAQRRLDELLNGRHRPSAGVRIELVKYNADQLDPVQRHRQGTGRLSRFGLLLAGLPIRLHRLHQRLAAHQPQAADLLPDAIFVDLHVAGLQVLHQPAFLIAHHQVERDFVHGGTDGRPALGLRGILRKHRAGHHTAECQTELYH
jgi:hypothetical protein